LQLGAKCKSGRGTCKAKACAEADNETASTLFFVTGLSIPNDCPETAKYCCVKREGKYYGHLWYVIVILGIENTGEFGILQEKHAAFQKKGPAE